MKKGFKKAASWVNEEIIQPAVSWVDEQIIQPVKQVTAHVAGPVKRFIAPLKKLVAPIAESVPIAWLAKKAMWLHPHTAPFAAAAWIAARVAAPLRRMFWGKKEKQNPQPGNEGQNSSSPLLPQSGNFNEVSTCS